MDTFSANIAGFAQRELESIITRLGNHYGFNIQEAMMVLDEERKPVSNLPVTKVPVSDLPVTKVPVSNLPVTKVPVSNLPVTKVPVSDLPVTDEPVSNLPVTDEPVTTKTKKWIKPRWVFPWTGHVVSNWCNGLRSNKGLLSQCQYPIKSNGMCSLCFKQTQEKGSPANGCVNDRVEHDKKGESESYTTSDGKKALLFNKVWKKMVKEGDVNKEDYIKEAIMFGYMITDDMFEGEVSKKGRPKKVVSKSKGENEFDEKVRSAVASIETAVTPIETAVTPIETAVTPIETAVTPIETAVTPIETAVTPIETAVTPIETAVTPIETPIEEDELGVTPIEEEVLDVKRFSFKGTDYLLDVEHNIVYDVDTHDAVGVWDETNDIIKELDPESSDEEGDDEE